MMSIQQEEKKSEQLRIMCNSVKKLCEEGEYEKCCTFIYKSMSEFPHAAQPHNLLGIVMEKMGDHLTAMKHFRAAWALDPSYRPANHNLNMYGTFMKNGICAFDDSDLCEETLRNIKKEE